MSMTTGPSGLGALIFILSVFFRLPMRSPTVIESRLGSAISPAGGTAEGSSAGGAPAGGRPARGPRGGRAAGSRHGGRGEGDRADAGDADDGGGGGQAPQGVHGAHVVVSPWLAGSWWSG